MANYGKDKFRYDYAYELRRAWEACGDNKPCLKELAMDWGITVPTVSNLMHGTIRLTRERADYLILAFDINIVRWCCSSSCVYELYKHDLSDDQIRIVKYVRGRVKNMDYFQVVGGGMQGFIRRRAEKRGFRRLT